MLNKRRCVTALLLLLVVSTPISGSPSTDSECSDIVSNLHLSSPPYDNYFLSDCHSSGQVVVTSPLPDSNLTIVSPRVVFAWPAGNSGFVAYFAPSNSINGTLGIRLVNSSIGSPLGPIYEPGKDAKPGSDARYGISTQIEFNASAELSVAILGSIRTIRDFVEGPSLLRPEIQSAVKYSTNAGSVAGLSRLWLDNITTTAVTFETVSKGKVKLDNVTISFEPGIYTVNASFNYPQLEELSPQDVLRTEATSLVSEQPDQTGSLAFLSYKSKLLAGAWRFLTYFGRDSMIAALLLQPVLSQGEGGAIEAVLAAVLERVNSTDGSVCHEETIGDYATWLNLQNNITSTAPQCDYKMIDSDYYLPILMDQYFVRNPNNTARAADFLNTTVSFFPAEGPARTYADMALLTCKRIMALAAPFAAPGNQTRENLMHLKPDQIVGQWRDSTYGIGGGRIPFDVNAALVPAALRAIAGLAGAGILPKGDDPQSLSQLAAAYADTWERAAPPFFDVSIPHDEAQKRLAHYTAAAEFNGSDASSTLDGESAVAFPALALEGNNNLSAVEVMHTDTAFRLFLVNDTCDEQLSRFVNDTAKSIQRPFPAGLMTDVGLLVANPAYGGDPVYAANWTRSAYHGTVVWSWQLAMMARGLELQLSRCGAVAGNTPAFCQDTLVHCNVRMAYNKLWDVIEANKAHLSTEVWSWTYEDGRFRYVDLGALPPPPGQSPTESDIVQLWSLTFLAVTRNDDFKGGCS